MASGSRLGPYALAERLGRGGMGEVFRATDERTGAVVALKIVDRSVADLDYLERFEREALTARSVSHSGVTRIHDSGVSGGVPYIAFELVAGGNLRDRLRREGRLPWREAARVAAELAEALEAVHDAGLIDRDLKPDNVLMHESGQLKLADFGLARAEGKSSLTESKVMLGTPEYMSPEQIEGRKDLDGRADIYSLGVILFELVTGELPFGMQGLALLKAHLLAVPRRPSTLVPGIPPELDALILELLAKSAAGRPKRAAHVAKTLETIAALPDPLPRWVRRLVAVAGLSVVLLGGVVVFVSTRGPAARPLPPAPPPPREAPKPVDLVALARKQFEANDPVAMRRSLADAIAADPDLVDRLLAAEKPETPGRAFAREALAARARSLLARSPDAALAASNTLLAEDAGNGGFLFLRATAEEALARGDDAFKDFGAAIDTGKLSKVDEAWAHLHRVDSLVDDSQRVAARDEAIRALDLVVGRGEPALEAKLHMRIGRLHYRLGGPDELKLAVSAADAGIAILASGPPTADLIQLHRNRRDALAWMQDDAAYRKELDWLIDNDRDKKVAANYRDWRAKVRFKMTDPQGALDDARAGLEMNPDPSLTDSLTTTKRQMEHLLGVIAK